MRRAKISVIGAGNVGASCALWAASKELGDIVLVETPHSVGVAKGKALDLFCASPMERYDANIVGTSDYKDVEGPAGEGTEVVVIDDVVTTGGSSLRAIEHVEAFGLHVDGVIAIIDRLEGGAEAFAERGYKLRTLLTIEDLGITTGEG